jgi:hypothetical protein
MPRALSLLLLLCLATPAWAEDAKTAADVTEPGRSLERALGVALGARQDGKRTLILLIDPTPSLRAAALSATLTRVLAPALVADPALKVGMAAMGDGKGLRVAPTRDAATILKAVEALMSAPKDAFRNVYADARRMASLLAKRSGARQLLLLTLENGDAEDDLEGAARALSKLKVQTSIITREAYLADSYYVSSTRKVPRGMTLGSGDAPFVTLPWGWLFQQTVANETTPSGYAHYGLTRLAAASGGRVFLYSPPGGKHLCTYIGTCPFCASDHQPTDESFQAHRLRLMTPSALSRAKAGALLARDPWFRAMLKAWDQASKAGLLRSRPSVKAGSGGVKPERRQQGAWAPLLGSVSGVKRLATKADKTRQVCEKIIASLSGSMEGIGEISGHPRSRAMCDFTLAMLHVTKANLVAYAAWCREAALKQLGKEPYPLLAPEVSPIVEGRSVAGISYTPMSLCHGVAPFRVLRLPGGKAWDSEVDALDKVVAGFMRRYAHTPYALALRHQGLAQFKFTYRGKVIAPPPRPTPGSTTDKPTTETGRPSRGGGSTSGGGSGSPTTGGG